mmetsp:Transcript_7380/g.6633  ORF Transcript_7380/g.6633 Transcript_7380/m.6633 type:complete len:82 (+) Transcript_7380:581-826(+)
MKVNRAQSPKQERPPHFENLSINNKFDSSFQKLPSQLPFYKQFSESSPGFKDEGMNRQVDMNFSPMGPVEKPPKMVSNHHN